MADIGTDLYLAYENGYEAGKKDATPKWISVKDRLPEYGKVLCVRKSEAFRGQRYVDILNVDHGWFMDGAFVVSDGNVTHWMPLPEPPKEAEDGN